MTICFLSGDYAGTKGHFPASFYDQDMIFIVIACLMFKVFYVDLPMSH